MEQLTKIDGIGQNELKRCLGCGPEKAGSMNENCGMCEHWQEALDMLTDYQSTGLTPEEIITLREEKKQLNHKVIIGKSALSGVNVAMTNLLVREEACKEEIISLQGAKERLEIELQHYKQAEADGQLIILPCDVDKPCYAITQINCEIMDCPKQDDNGDCKHDCPNIIFPVYFDKVTVAELLGVPLFATVEAAGVALSELNKNGE